jgi:phage shock protein A
MARQERLYARADRKLGRAQKNYNKAQEAIAADKANPSTTSNAPAYINKKLDRAMILEDKARELKAKADAMKKGGSVTAKKMVTKKKK